MRFAAAMRSAALFAAAAFSLILCATTARADMSAIRINEIGWATKAGDVNTQFVELVATAPGQTRDAELHLEITSALGTTNDVLVSFGAAEGATWPQDGPWLLGGTAFTTKTGLTRDGALSKLDATGGKLTLYTYDLNGDRVDLDTYAWGRDPGLPRAPYNGQSLQRVPYGFTTQAHPTPTNSKGAHSIDIGYGYEPQTSWTIDEAFFQCANGTAGASYISLLSGRAQFMDNNLYVRVLNGFGGLITQTHAFGTSANQTIAAGSHWLCATSALQTSAGITADLTLAAPPSIAGGVVAILLANAAADSLTPLMSVPYGASYDNDPVGVTGVAPLPPKGYALGVLADGNFFVRPPAPVNRLGQASPGTSCFSQPTAGGLWHVSELGLDCSDSVPGFWYVSIAPDFLQLPDPRLGLRILDHTGAVVFDRPGLSADASKPSFLLASQPFVNSTGFTPDIVVPVDIDHAGGTVQIYATTSPGVTQVISNLAYGSANPVVGLPTPGGCLRYQSPNVYASVLTAAPKRADGATSGSACFGPNGASFRVAEFSLGCTDTTALSAFVELSSYGAIGTLDGRMGMRVTDHLGALVGDLRSSFATAHLTTSFTSPNLLLGQDGFNAASGVTRDAPLPVAFDLLGGTLTLYRNRVDGSEEVLNTLRYGSAGAPLPLGTSLQLIGADNYALQGRPTPTNSHHETVALGRCYGPIAGAGYHIDEFGTDCLETIPGFWFLGIAPDFAQLTADARLTLRLYNHLGTLLLQRSSLGVTSGGPDFLIASKLFASATGSKPDLVIDADVDHVGGEVQLAIVQSGRDSVLSSLRYGNVTKSMAPLPPPGGSIKLTGSVFSVQAHATPTVRSGAVINGACFDPADVRALRISELGMRCRSGVPSRAFLELIATDSLATLNHRLGLALYDSRGVLLGDLHDAFDQKAGVVIAKGRNLLIANATFASVGPVPDMALAVQPDTLGGRLVLYEDHLDGTQLTLSDVTYGSGDHYMPAGWSLSRQADGSYVRNQQPDPTNLAGVTGIGSGCYGAPIDWPVMVRRIGTRCADGAAASFIDLEFLAAGPISPDLGLLVQDSSGATVLDRPGFVNTLGGWVPRAHQHLLLGTDAFAARSGRPADVRLPAELDIRSGGVVLYMDPDGDVSRRHWFSSIGYGFHGIPAPAPGASLVQGDDHLIRPFLHGAAMDSSGMPRVTACYSSPDTSLRIAELGLGCYSGTHDLRYVVIQSLDLNQVVSTGLHLRIRDPQGALLEDAAVNSPDIVGKSWAYQLNDYDPLSKISRRILFSTDSLGAAEGYKPDVNLAKGPLPDSGEVQLCYRDSLDGRFTVLDSWRYGVVGGLPAPLPGRSLTRAADGTITTQDKLVATNFLGYQTGYYSDNACTSPITFGLYVSEALLQCADGGTGGQYIEIRTENARLFDSNCGLEIHGADGHLMADITHVFASRAWQAFPAGGSFLLAQPGARALTGHDPDAVLPTTLDSLGGELRLYRETLDGTRVNISSLRYGAPALLPAPGFPMRAYPDIYVIPHYSYSPVPRPAAHTAAGDAWAPSACITPFADLRISEMAMGCGYDSDEGAGEFIELRNAGSDLTLGAGWSLHCVSRDRPDQHFALFSGHQGQTLSSGANWLTTGKGFAYANQLDPDEAILVDQSAYTEWNVTLQWTPPGNYTPVDVDRVASASIPFGTSLEQTPTRTLIPRTAPDPHNSRGDGLSGPDACLSPGSAAVSTFIEAFSPGCPEGGAASAFVELGYIPSVDNYLYRLRIEDHYGAVVFDQGTLFGATNRAPPDPHLNGGYPRFLLGASGFSKAAMYDADRELPLPFDPLGGWVTLYKQNPAGPDSIAGRIHYGALLPGNGMVRERDYPYPSPLRAQVSLPVDYSNKPTWSCYGEPIGALVTVASAGMTCPDGDPTTRFVQLATPYEDRHFYYVISPLKGGWIFTFDHTGALLDSVTVMDSTDVIQYIVRPVKFAMPFFGSGALTTDLIRQSHNRAPAMDPHGGTIQFRMVDPLGRPAGVADSKSYGSVIGAPVPSGAFVGKLPATLGFPSEAVVSACPPCSETIFQYGAGAWQRWSTASVDTIGPLAPSKRPNFRFFSDQHMGRSGMAVGTHIEGDAAGSTTTAYTLIGPNPGAKARIHVWLALSGWVRTYNGSQPYKPVYLVQGVIDTDRETILQRAWRTDARSDTTYPATERLGADIDVVVGQPFRLTTHYRSLLQNAYLDSMDVTAEWQFQGLPTGTSITNCQGYQGSPVPTALALTRAEAFADHVELQWFGGSTNTRFALERRQALASASSGESAWLPLATLLADGEGRLSYRDEQVTEGATYDYRITTPDGQVIAQTRLQVPKEARLTLAIAGSQPVHGALAFAVTRPGSAAARLEVFDIAGRLVESRAFMAGGAVAQRVEMNPAQGHAGIFLARLTCGRESRTVRVVRVP